MYGVEAADVYSTVLRHPGNRLLRYDTHDPDPKQLNSDFFQRPGYSSGKWVLEVELCEQPCYSIPNITMHGRKSDQKRHDINKVLLIVLVHVV